MPFLILPCLVDVVDSVQIRPPRIVNIVLQSAWMCDILYIQVVSTLDVLESPVHIDLGAGNILNFKLVIAPLL